MVRQHAREFYTRSEGRFESCSAHHSADIPIPQGSSPGHRGGRNEWSDGDVVIQMEWITWTPLHACNDPVCGNCNVVFPSGLKGNSTPGYSGAQIKCFSLSEDFLSPVAFSINSSQTDKRLPIGLDTFYHSSYYPRRYGATWPADKIGSRLAVVTGWWIYFTHLVETQTWTCESCTQRFYCGGIQIALCHGFPLSSSSSSPPPLRLTTIYSHQL